MAAPEHRPSYVAQAGPLRFRETAGWKVVLGAAAALAVGGAILAVVWLLARPLALLLLAITIARGLEPVVCWAERAMRRTLAVVAVFGAIAGVLVILAFLLTPVITGQFSEIRGAVPEFAGAAQQFLQRWTGIQNVDVSQLLGRIAGPLSEIPARLLSGLGGIVVIVFLSIYWLLEESALYRFVLSLVPPARREPVGRTLVRMGDAMGGYLRGALINAAVVGSLAWGMLLLVGVPYSGVLGLFAAAGEMVPYVGPIAAAIPAVLAALSVSTHTAVIVVLLYVALEQLEGHLLTPNIMRTQTRAPAGLVLLSFTAGWFIGGLLGGVVAIPVGAALRVLVVDAVAPVVRRYANS